MFGRGKSGKCGSCSATGALRRGLADFALALALFWVVAIAVSHSRAHAVPLPVIGKEAILLDVTVSSPVNLRATASPPAAAVNHKAQAGQQHALALLSIAFAAIFACNLAFWRHLRRVYASPRRSAWRRG